MICPDFFFCFFFLIFLFCTVYKSYLLSKYTIPYTFSSSIPHYAATDIDSFGGITSSEHVGAPVRARQPGEQYFGSPRTTTPLTILNIAQLLGTGNDLSVTDLELE